MLNHAVHLRTNGWRSRVVLRDATVCVQRTVLESKYPVFECNACQEKYGAFKEFRGGKTAAIQPKPAA